MLPVEIARLAQRDIEDIYEYGFENFGQTATEAYLATIMRLAYRLAEFPGLGQPVSGRSDAIRRLSCGSHIIVYGELNAALLIVRVLHHRMDFDRHI